MSQNRSTAVMQRRVEAHDSLDDFPTPPWAVRALCEFLQNPCDELINKGCPPHAPTTWPLTVREPAANRGYLARPLAEYFKRVEVSDVHDYGMGYPVQDFLFPEPLMPVDWTITNPPFRLGLDFVRRALGSSRCGVAMIVRSAFLEGQERHASLFSSAPPTTVLQFSERVVMHKARCPDPNVAVLNEKTGKMEKPTTATAYAWLIWEGAFIDRTNQRRQGTDLRWIAPCRSKLERPGDYDVWPKVAAEDPPEFQWGQP